VKIQAIRWGLAVAALCACMLGCENEEDDIDGVRFSNDSSHAVTLFVGPFSLLGEDPDLILMPGDEQDIKYEYSDHVYFDWQPKDKVAANQVEDNHVVFVDKSSSP
jgi:hypothetical protein